MYPKPIKSFLSCIEYMSIYLLIPQVCDCDFSANCWRSIHFAIRLQPRSLLSLSLIEI